MRMIRSRRALLILPLLMMLASSLFVLPVRGETDDVITDDQIQVIRTRCTQLKATLRQLHDSDLLLRYNRGELYRTISDDLMSPLNQRIASNQLDGADLVKVTANYTTAYQQFFNAYKSYETALSTLMEIDCTKQPTTFYSQLLDTRNKRVTLHDASERLVTLAETYKSNFDAFRKAALKKEATSE